MRLSTAVLSALLMLTASSSTVWAELNTSVEVNLRSRTFVPDPGVEDARSYLQARGVERGHVMLQLADPHDHMHRQLLEDAGVEFLHYLPHNTWVVSLDRADLNAPLNGLVRWAAPIQREDRLHPRLQEGGPRDWALAPDGQWRLRVRFFGDVSMDDARARLIDLGASLDREIPDFRSFEILGSRFVVEALAVEDGVQWVRETAPPKVEDNDGNREQTKAQTLHDSYNLKGQGMVAGIWDNGSADQGHPDFSGRLTTPDGPAIGDHATHVTGTVGGSGVNSQPHGGSNNEWKGMAPEADLISYDWNNPYTEHDEAINTYGASTSSNSWSYGVSDGNCDDYGDYDFGAEAYDEIIGGLYGGAMVVSHSAGNERNDGDCGMVGGPDYPNYETITPPSTSKNMLTVGAINSNDDSMTSFSSWGPVDDGRIKPDIVGPGCQTSGDGGTTSTFPGGGYVSWCGTSMSTPTVSGCVVLLQQAYFEEHGFLPTPALTKAILLDTARDLGNPGPDYSFGFGALDVQAAVDQMSSGAFVEDVLSLGEEKLFTFEVQVGDPIAQATLAWTDPASTPTSGSTLINDLDLVLISPDGTEFNPWNLNPNLPQLDAQKQANHRDPHEQVTVDSPLPGTWLAKVTATNLPQGPQAFAVAGTSPEPPCAGSNLDVPTSYATIQDAIDAAAFCDTISVAPGTYTEQLTLHQKVILKSTNGPGVTTIQAPAFQRAIIAESNAVIDGFTVFQGVAFGSFPNGYGGGIYGEYVSPEIRNCRFRGCVAQGEGAAAFFLSGSPVFESCEFDSNYAVGNGAAIGLSDCFAVEITGNVFSDGVADGHGGALSIGGSSLDIVGNTFADNTAGGIGGAVYMYGGVSGSFSNNIVANNTATTAGGVQCSPSGAMSFGCNDYWMNAPDDQVDCAAGTDDIAADPLFCNPSIDDYAFPLDSPCAPGQTPGSCGLIGAVEAVEECGTTVGVSEGGGSAIPAVFAVGGARPNPLRAGATIRLALPEAEMAFVSVYDVSGREVRRLHRGVLPAGVHQVRWDGQTSGGDRVAPGLYFYEVRAGKYRASRKVVVVP